MLRAILGVVAGLVVAVVLIAAIQCVNLVLYPPPEGLKMDDQAAMRAYIATLPPQAFVTVLVSYAVGTLAGAWLNAKIAGGTLPLCGNIILGTILLAASIMNLKSIPHPVWFEYVNLLMIFPIAHIGSCMGGAGRRAA